MGLGNAVRIRFAILVILLGISSAQGQSIYPEKPVTLIIPHAPGSLLDINARLFITEFVKKLGQPVIALNRPGAGGLLGVRAAKSAPPDGYTLLWHSHGITMLQALLRKPDVDIRRDLAPISLVQKGDLGIWVNAAVPVKSFKELVDYARQNPGKLNFGSNGVGGALHLPMELLFNNLAIKLVHVPYTSAASQALVKGDVHVLLWDIANLSKQKGGVRLIAVATNERSAAFPEVPTVIESGVNFAAAYWMGLFAPAGTPQPILLRLNALVKEILEGPDMKAALKNQAFVPNWTPIDVLKEHIANEVAQWVETVQKSNIPRSDD